ncbi:MAG: tyrosine-type recombinase/integrase [Desulfobacterales bacterium]|jgi:integrase
MSFLDRLGEVTKQATKKFRYALLKAFFNFLRNTIDESLPNPCDTLIMRKIFREPKISRWDILEKDLVDEMIFRTRNRRDRLMLELMARSGMRVGEVLKIRAGDVVDQKIIFRIQKAAKNQKRSIFRTRLPNASKITSEPATSALLNEFSHSVIQGPGILL